MVRRTRWKKDWHHRVPDFKLVYCGPKICFKEDTKELPEEKIEDSITNVGHVAVVESCINGSKTPKS